MIKFLLDKKDVRLSKKYIFFLMKGGMPIESLN